MAVPNPLNPEKEKEEKRETTPETAPNPVKVEPKEKTKKSESVKSVYPPYAGWSCPVCGSKRITDDSGKYICPTTPQPSDCPVK